MACPNGYIELNGNCVYAFGNDSGIGPDGTPLPPPSGGSGFWNWMKENLPGILIGVGTVWQAGQSGGSENTHTGTPPPPVQAQQKMPTWAWFALALAAIAILFLLLRRR